MLFNKQDDEFSFEAFSPDATVFEVHGRWYYVWAEKVGVGKQIFNLYIAEMENGYTLKTVQVLLTTPDYDWERVGFWVNEGPGHNSFTKDEDGNDIMVYQARKETVIEGDPLYNPNRHAMLMQVRWENDRPVFSYR